MVSIIIPTTPQEKEKLNICIKSLENSMYKNIEIIIVNKGLERSAQRNIGIKQAKGEYLLFLDSDMSIHPALIWECVERTQKNTINFYIPEIITTKGIFGAIRRWERKFYTGTAVDVIRFVKRENCPLFDETMSGPEDSDWERRVAGAREITAFPVYHNDGINFKTYCKKKIYYTQSMKRYSEKNPNDKILNLKYRCWTIFIENGKWKRLIKNPFMTLGVIFILLTRGIIYYGQNFHTHSCIQNKTKH